MPDLKVDRSLPEFTERLPPLSQDECREAMRAVRAVKKGRLYVCRFKLHERQQALKMEWSAGGGAQLVG